MSNGGDEGGSKNNSNMFKKNYRRENRVTVDVLDD